MLPDYTHQAGGFNEEALGRREHEAVHSGSPTGALPWALFLAAPSFIPATLLIFSGNQRFCLLFANYPGVGFEGLALVSFPLSQMAQATPASFREAGFLSLRWNFFLGA